MKIRIFEILEKANHDTGQAYDPLSDSTAVVAGATFDRAQSAVPS
jgi:hypothetical protein